MYFVSLSILKSAKICDIFYVFTKKHVLNVILKITFFVGLVEIQFSIKCCLPPSAAFPLLKPFLRINVVKICVFVYISALEMGVNAIGMIIPPPATTESGDRE